MIINIVPNITRSQSSSLFISSFSKILLFLLLITVYLFQIAPAQAIVDPLASPNNKFGIHIISASTDEIQPSAILTNSSGGDWGYITVLVESKDRKEDKWKAFFNELRERHLIPLVRLATEPQGSNWKRPYEGEEEAWADFLDKLNWPTKNRYVIIYNEPNHGSEWGGSVDPSSYAKTLDKTITALKKKSPDFFVLNAGLDASTPYQPPAYMDEVSFIKEMEKAVPGIFNKLDGWVSHSYPNPEFSGSPNDFGRGSIRSWAFEKPLLESLSSKNLPIFITETGWKHAEGKSYNSRYPTAEKVAQYYQTAFENAWSFPEIVAVTPFLLNYQDPPFDHFSFKKITGEKQSEKILGLSFPEYYPQYETLLNMPKVKGLPYQDDKAKILKGEVYSSIVSGEDYQIPITFENTGQSIWGERGDLKLHVLEGQSELGIKVSSLPGRVKPGEQATFNLSLHAPNSGNFKVSLQLYHGSKPFDQKPFEFKTEVKPPVILNISANLKWKEDQSGEYLLFIESTTGTTITTVSLNRQGDSGVKEVRYLLPDYTFKFTLKRPYYKEKTVELKLQSGINQLNFGELQPDFISALLKPQELWQLLPFSN